MEIACLFSSFPIKSQLFDSQFALLVTHVYRVLYQVDCLQQLLPSLHENVNAVLTTNFNSLAIVFTVIHSPSFAVMLFY